MDGGFGSWEVDINWVEGGTKQVISEVGINSPKQNFSHAAQFSRQISKTFACGTKYCMVGIWYINGAAC